MSAEYQRLRDWLVAILERKGFVCYPPSGAYYLMTDISRFGYRDDVEFATYLVRDVGVATIPGSSSTLDPATARRWSGSVSRSAKTPSAKRSAGSRSWQPAMSA